MAYPDLHDHLKMLDEKGFLLRIKRPINKDTELHPLVRWQYRGGLDDRDRKAFLFENVVDSSGKQYRMHVVVGALAGSTPIYYAGVGCKDAAEMEQKWERALHHPLGPCVVEQAVCQEEVHMDGSLLEH